MFIEENGEGSTEYVYYTGMLMTDNTAVYETEFVFSISKTDVDDPL